MLRCVAARNKDEPRPVDLSRQRSEAAGDSEADNDTDSSGSSSESEADSDGDDMPTDVLAARAAGVRACVGVPPPAAIVALTAAVDRSFMCRTRQGAGQHLRHRAGDEPVHCYFSNQGEIPISL